MALMGTKSQCRLMECDKRLVRLVSLLSDQFDLIVVCGHRGKEDQEAAVTSGASPLHFPKSKHNVLPSRAVDIAPYPYKQYMNDKGKHDEMLDLLVDIAEKEGIPIRLGRIWGDYPHVELA